MKKKKLWIAVGVVILFVAIGGIFGKRNENADNADSGTKSTSNVVAETSSVKSSSSTSSTSSANDKLGDLGFLEKNVRNDTTGNYRIMKIAEDVQIEDIALDYYKKYFSDSKEVHFIINFSKNTTTSITDMGTLLDVTVHEYVSKEEHDAKALGGGTVLAEYHVDKETGKVEKVQ